MERLQLWASEATDQSLVQVQKQWNLPVLQVRGSLLQGLARYEVGAETDVEVCAPLTCSMKTILPAVDHKKCILCGSAMQA